MKKTGRTGKELDLNKSFKSKNDFNYLNPLWGHKM
jgi:hypothetical protein